MDIVMTGGHSRLKLTLFLLASVSLTKRHDANIWGHETAASGTYREHYSTLLVLWVIKENHPNSLTCTYRIQCNIFTMEGNGAETNEGFTDKDTMCNGAKLTPSHAQFQCV